MLWTNLHLPTLQQTPRNGGAQQEWVQSHDTQPQPQKSWKNTLQATEEATNLTSLKLIWRYLKHLWVTTGLPPATWNTGLYFLSFVACFSSPCLSSWSSLRSSSPDLCVFCYFGFTFCWYFANISPKHPDLWWYFGNENSPGRKLN